MDERLHTIWIRIFKHRCNQPKPITPPQLYVSEMIPIQAHILMSLAVSFYTFTCFSQLTVDLLEYSHSF